MTLLKSTSTALCISALALSACATTIPPAELVDARRAYTEAEASEAARYNPAALHEAKTSLTTAEVLFSHDADSAEIRDAAYIATRRAQRAQAEGETASLQSRTKAAIAASQQAQAKAAEKTKDELTSARTQLAQATDAREAAEQRAKDAMLKLQLSKAASVAEQPRGTVVTVAGGFLFRSDESALMPSAHEKLDKIVEAVKEQGNRRIVVEGHTDSRGEDAYNMNLSKQRADAVLGYLVSHGIARDKVTASGKGSTQPVASNDTPEGRASNRRVEITIEKTEPH